MKNLPYDQRIARVLVRPLARLGATPNQVTAVGLLLALGAGALFAIGWALALGLVGATAALLAMGLNLDLDRQLELGEGEAVGYPGWGGIELEDGIYLLAPVTWIGWLEPFFAAAGLAAAAYLLWTLGRVLRARMPG